MVVDVDPPKDALSSAEATLTTPVVLTSRLVDLSSLLLAAINHLKHPELISDKIKEFYAIFQTDKIYENPKQLVVLLRIFLSQVKDNKSPKNSSEIAIESTLVDFQRYLMVLFTKNIVRNLRGDEKAFLETLSSDNQAIFIKTMDSISGKYSFKSKKPENCAETLLSELVASSFKDYSKPIKDPHQGLLLTNLIKLNELAGIQAEPFQI